MLTQINRCMNLQQILDYLLNRSFETLILCLSKYCYGSTFSVDKGLHPWMLNLDWLLFRFYVSLERSLIKMTLENNHKFLDEFII